MSGDAIQALENLLDRERHALVNGDLDQLDQMTREKEKLVGEIRGLQADEETDLSRVQTMIERNQALLSSAAEGIRAVAQRMVDLRRVRRELATYDAAGQRSDLAMHDYKRLEKRA